MVFRNPQELVANLPDTDFVIATLWKTAPWVEQLVQNGHAKKSVYFVQDYEPWFFRADQKELRKRVKDTYRMIENKIVKSEWLRQKMVEADFSSHKIPLGMDLGRFYPRDVNKNKTGPSILAMARPQTPRRGFRSIIEALERVKRIIPRVEVVLFGDRFLDSYQIPFPFRNEGIITDQEKLARLYSEADLFLDGSDFQGFGRCGLEAMACGTACVLTDAGGVSEYARDGENALLVPPGRTEAFAQTVVNILQDPKLKQRLIKEGLTTARGYCHKREARETLAYFCKITGK